MGNSKQNGLGSLSEAGNQPVQCWDELHKPRGPVLDMILDPDILMSCHGTMQILLEPNVTLISQYSADLSEVLGCV